MKEALEPVDGVTVRIYEILFFIILKWSNSSRRCLCKGIETRWSLSFLPTQIIHFKSLGQEGGNKAFLLSSFSSITILEGLCKA